MSSLVYFLLLLLLLLLFYHYHHHYPYCYYYLFIALLFLDAIYHTQKASCVKKSNDFASPSVAGSG